MLHLTLWTLFCLLIATVIVLYKYMTRYFDYWKKRGVFFEKPLPFFGNTLDVFLFRSTLGDWLKSISQSTKERYFGLFVFDKPCLVINDPSLLKYILISDFNIFRNRSVASGEHDDIMRDLIFFQKDNIWRTTRANISLLFSPGRLKKMFLIMKNIGVDFEDFLGKNLGDNDDIKELVTKWALEVISQTSFGIRPNSFLDQNLDYSKFSKKLFTTTLANSFAQLCYFFKQEWVELFNLVFFPKDALLYFKNIFGRTMQSREQSGLKANDIIDIIIEAKRNKKTDTTDSALAASVVTIIVGGLESTSTTLSFFLYELARNPEVQNKLRCEIIETTKKHGELTFDALSEMKYLEMCLSEILRMYPTLPFLDRVCAEDYKLPDTDLLIEKGMNIYIPIYAFHFNEKFYTDPYKFNPDRFEDGTNMYKDSMKFLAFGAGPRICIGERFGILASKTCICYLLTKFEVVPNSKTPEKIKFSVKSQLRVAEGGLPMCIQKHIPIDN